MVQSKENKSAKSLEIIPDIKEFLLHPSLNKKINITKENYRAILDIEFSNESVKLPCPYCNEEKDFILDYKESRDLFLILKMGFDDSKEHFDEIVYKHVITDRIFERKLRCTTKNCVEYSIYFGVHNCQFYKIWQKSTLPNLK